MRRDDAVFKLRVADYINKNMLEHGLTYKDLARISGVSDSSIHTYAQAKVGNPSEDNLIRIAAAFGDPPEIIQQMRRETMESSAKENQIIAKSNDKEQMEQFAALMRTNIATMFEEYRSQSAAQQTEIIEHADKRVEEERARASELNAKVLKQCQEEVARNKAFYDERYKMMQEHCEQRIADMRAHMEDVVQEKRDSEKRLSKQFSRSRAYLKSSIRNLCLAGGILLITNIFFGAYAIFAYTTFDMADPTRGLHRETHSVGPMMLFLAIVAVGVAVALVISMLAKKPKTDEEE